MGERRRQALGRGAVADHQCQKIPSAGIRIREARPIPPCTPSATTPAVSAINTVCQVSKRPRICQHAAEGGNGSVLVHAAEGAALRSASIRYTATKAAPPLSATM